jgi:hypothetical protein
MNNNFNKKTNPYQSRLNLNTRNIGQNQEVQNTPTTGSVPSHFHQSTRTNITWGTRLSLSSDYYTPLAYLPNVDTPYGSQDNVQDNQNSNFDISTNSTNTMPTGIPQNTSHHSDHSASLQTTTNQPISSITTNTGEDSVSFLSNLFEDDDDFFPNFNEETPSDQNVLPPSHSSITTDTSDNNFFDDPSLNALQTSQNKELISNEKNQLTHPDYPVVSSAMKNVHSISLENISLDKNQEKDPEKVFISKLHRAAMSKITGGRDLTWQIILSCKNAKALMSVINKASDTGTSSKNIDNARMRIETFPGTLLKLSSTSDPTLARNMALLFMINLPTKNPYAKKMFDMLKDILLEKEWKGWPVELLPCRKLCLENFSDWLKAICTYQCVNLQDGTVEKIYNKMVIFCKQLNNEMDEDEKKINPSYKSFEISDIPEEVTVTKKKATRKKKVSDHPTSEDNSTKKAKTGSTSSQNIQMHQYPQTSQSSQISQNPQMYQNLQTSQSSLTSENLRMSQMTQNLRMMQNPQNSQIPQNPQMHQYLQNSQSSLTSQNPIPQNFGMTNNLPSSGPQQRMLLPRPSLIAAAENILLDVFGNSNNPLSNNTADPTKIFLENLKNCSTPQQILDFVSGQSVRNMVQIIQAIWKAPHPYAAGQLAVIVLAQMASKNLNGGLNQAEIILAQHIVGRGYITDRSWPDWMEEYRPTITQFMGLISKSN